MFNCGTCPLHFSVSMWAFAGLVVSLCVVLIVHTWALDGVSVVTLWRVGV